MTRKKRQTSKQTSVAITDGAPACHEVPGSAVEDRQQSFTPPRVRSAYSRPERQQINFPDPGRTQQHFKEECDVNRIVKRFTETGTVNHMTRKKGEYGFASAQTFADAQFIVAKARSEFESLPSNIRAHFANDPAKFLDAVQDETRAAEFVELGLLEAEIPAEIEEPAEALSEPPETPSEVE